MLVQPLFQWIGNHCKRLHIACLLVIALGLGSGLSVWADCKASYDQALTVLDGAKQQAIDNQHPNADEFSAKFQPIVFQMQKAQCISELMNLLQYIQAEQKKYPAPDKKTAPAPIVD